jgi:hypothetical protein
MTKSRWRPAPDASPRGIRGLALCVVAVVLTLPGAGAEAQTSRSDPTDVQARLGIGVTLDLPDGWEAGAKYQLRLVDDLTEYRGSYLYAEGSKSLGDVFELLGEYRLALLEGRTAHRLAVGTTASGRIGETRVSFRPLLQYQIRIDQADDEQSSQDEVLLRTRLRARHRVGESLRVYGSIEPHWRFGADYPIDNWRNTVGLEWEFAADRTVDLYYIFRPDYGKSYNRTFHVVGVEMDVELAPLRRRR